MPASNSNNTSSHSTDGARRTSAPTTSSQQSIADSHRPSVPSGLRQLEMPPSSPEALANRQREEAARHEEADEETREVDEDEHMHTRSHDWASAQYAQVRAEGEPEEPRDAPTVRTRLLADGHRYHVLRDGAEDGYEGTHPSISRKFKRWYGSIASNFSGVGPEEEDEHHSNMFTSHLTEEPENEGGRTYRGDYLDDGIANGNWNKVSRQSTTEWLVKKYGVDHERWLYILYYIPITNWIRQYRWSYLKGDFIAAVTMASFYIPMALSLASNLAHVPPINGLYTFAINPIIYAILGTCPRMVVGPEAAGSLLTGSVVREAIRAGTHPDEDGSKHAQVAGMVTGLAGSFILVAGLCRLGFLDGVLSRPFLRGFISAIGITILVDQLIPEMGLTQIAKVSEAAQHGSPLEKIMFLFRHGHEAHRLTCIVSFSTIAIVLVLREIKRRLQPRFPSVAYVPDRFLVVVLSAVFARSFKWEAKGLSLLGDIRSDGTPFRIHFPFDEANFRHVNDAFSTAFIISLLGFFESSVAAKSLGSGSSQVKKVRNKQGEEVEEVDGIKDLNLSPNRELVALGVANLCGGLFMALPGFGGYGRSKVNASTGGKTPMSSIFLALITIVCIYFLLPYFYHIPKGVLSAMISVVAYSLIEEAPHDIRFFLRISGYIELALMTLIFLATFFWNLKIGIAVGIGLSLLRLLKHSTRPRIQILGRVPGTNEFESAELYGGRDEDDARNSVEMVPHCLIVKIPEPLTFANTGSLKDRLRRLEDQGSTDAHPAFPKSRSGRKENIIFDVHGVTKLDPAAVQVLLEIVESYIDRGTRVFFCRIPSRKTEVWRLMNVSGLVEKCGGEGHFLHSVEDALRATEREGSFAEMGEDRGLMGPAGGRRHTWAAIYEVDERGSIDLERS